MSPELQKIIARLLHYSFRDIKFQWRELTHAEQVIIGTPENFDLLLEFVARNTEN